MRCFFLGRKRAKRAKSKNIISKCFTIILCNLFTKQNLSLYITLIKNKNKLRQNLKLITKDERI